ncbi:mannitol dehydrogenase family protein [Xinfangfangia sp. D13-10-4-6]|uniref:mannitol dehydrogenase family protein n=1 Tax=Pseudogemmobacter hezensis TaxID=2737662 RepID=UPI001554A9BB|nr:mannitol dehydrogenase family protein [Pseudogemmobacter hezensis]NPD14886.1 mannitol dehydrogenase family protein [Pseudogemmobacter hezensis]
MRTPILQFGTSRFLQAHADLFISEALARGPGTGPESGQAIGPVSVVQSSGDASRAGRLQALAAPEGYRVRIEGIEGGQTVRRETRVTSVRRTLATGTDWAEVARIAADEAEVILSNTGDSGWQPQAADHAPDFRQEMSFPAKLTHLLRARYIAGGAPLTVMPTELVPRNGDVLRARVLELAGAVDPALADWIAGRVVFANSLVDRIVSEPLEPAGAVAEPYALWAIEAQPGLVLPCRHPCIQLVPDLHRIERLKLHILNLGHSYMVSRWIVAGGGGAPLVREVMADPAARADLESLYAAEVLPVFAAAGYDEAPAYVASTLDRFANPYLAHRLSDIAQSHADKLQRRIGLFLDWGAGVCPGLSQPRLKQALTQADYSGRLPG